MTILKDTEHKLNEAQRKQDEQTLTELAKLSLIEFDRVKKEKADVMGIKVSTLESEVKKIRPKDVDDRKQGRSITIHEVDPWESPVDPAELLDEISERINRHMVIRPEYADACTLWVVHDHVFDLFDHTPRLVINGPEPECGKTLLMTHIVGNMVNRRKTTELMKAAPFFRMVEIYRPTFLIDEVDVFERIRICWPPSITGLNRTDVSRSVWAKTSSHVIFQRIVPLQCRVFVYRRNYPGPH